MTTQEQCEPVDLSLVKRTDHCTDHSGQSGHKDDHLSHRSDSQGLDLRVTKRGEEDCIGQLGPSSTHMRYTWIHTHVPL